MKAATVIRTTLLLASTLALLGCVKPALHRAQSIEDQPKYSLAYIEFDDHGEPWAPSQLERAVDLIENANRGGKKVAVVLFVHGWQNDASNPEDRKKDNNVEGFKRLLDEIVDRAEIEGRYDENTSLIGVYLGWRGRSSNNKLVKPLTFYSRRGAGQRVAGVSTTEAILRVMGAAKKNPESVGVVIGHSFGGMIVEQALAQSMIGYTVASDEIIAPLADLVILVNPASQSIVAKNMLSILQRNRLKLFRIGEQGNRRESPMVVSVTSTADTATGNLYPMAMGLKGGSKRFRDYEASDCSPASKQKSFYKQTAGHNPALHSHIVTAKPVDEEARTPDDTFVVTQSINPETGDKSYSWDGPEYRFTIDRVPYAYNDTPYWIMSVPPELIRNHSDIFTANTLGLLRALLKITRPVGSTERSIVVREKGVRPLALATLPGGGLVFLERSRRFYGIPSGSRAPLALSCLPGVVLPDSVIGGYVDATRVYLILNQQKKKKNEEKRGTFVIDFDFLVAGVESQRMIEIRSDLHFFSATGDPRVDKVYLATHEELYVADLTEKHPVAELLSRFESKVELDEMDFDPFRDRIFATVREDGALYVIDLQSESPTPVLVTDELGIPTEMEIARDGTLFVVDAVGKRVLRLDCSEQSSCTAPEMFATHPGFERPVSLALHDTGQLSVGDVDAQSIFLFDGDGKLLRVLGSLEGAAEY